MKIGIRSPWQAFAFWVAANFFITAAAAQDIRSVLRQTPNVEHGAALFRNCVSCHGADGLGAPDGSVPIIAAQHSSVIAKQLVDYRHAKRWDIRMERIADRHVLQDAQDVADVAAYAAGLERATRATTGDGAQSKEGAETYAQRCAGCHGAAGGGDPKKQVPRLATQHYDYLLRQMHDAAEGRRPNLSSAHKRLLKGFVMEDFEGVADYLSQLH